ncbi:MAG: GCN5-related N-acetyltransferase [uncultured bacterium (gcode 4)]|uniref:GCN5-related N-acetyltransferase n=1 Tax=uncultured bacterium (gcode 4) TaxID=1234023 RepID=K2FWT8_9BACT|nr:MAG: GCN5-related N-acetyltransferase [uncultured bacterium (gcode 4)]
MDLTLIKIRKAIEQDYKYCYRLTKINMLGYFTKYWGGWKSENFLKNFNHSETNIILKNDRRIGYYVIKNKSDYYYLDNIQISPLMKGKWIGSFIMKLIEEQIIKTKANIIRLEVFKDNPAKKLYERFDYKIIKDNWASVLMEKILSK